ncbi:hypothetical protein [Methylobacterium iners]|uniref:Uncharacterized protein n=1 Tax=Methylobacterium iners TaxID=418707 RepID=A0ABQ4S6Q8_9HYPH|nr:hypothetical protein [Methylobacterium iners]GJD97488.1 hypothetical protein OCOJLMKI_4719 [Methylobacterium iners]
MARFPCEIRGFARVHASRPARAYPEADAARAVIVAGLASARYRMKVRGDDLVARHNAEAGHQAATELERETATQIATSFEGSPIEFCARVKARVPSAKPCRMPGMNSQRVRTQLRAGDIETWGLDRLLAVAASLGLRAEIRLVPIEGIHG